MDSLQFGKSRFSNPSTRPADTQSTQTPPLSFNPAEKITQTEIHPPRTGPLSGDTVEISRFKRELNPPVRK